MKDKTAAKIFIENYVDENGWSEIIFIDDLVNRHGDKFMSNNGCQWARDNQSSCKFYNIQRFNAKSMGMTDKYNWNKIVAIQFQGLKNLDEINNHNIPSEIRTSFKNIPCAILGVVANFMEIDHKNGRYDEQTYEFDDFQSLSKAANDAKREHCKKCKISKIRYKASQLGYSIDFIEGDENSSFCQGCYWNDPQKFNRIVSANFKKREEE